jgi:hypothetical protein
VATTDCSAAATAVSTKGEEEEGTTTVTVGSGVVISRTEVAIRIIAGGMGAMAARAAVSPTRGPRDHSGVVVTAEEDSVVVGATVVISLRDINSEYLRRETNSG